jgi:hypothetical protein
MAKTVSFLRNSIGRSSSLCRTCRTAIVQTKFARQLSSYHRSRSESNREIQLDYRPAFDWEGLEWVGTNQWILEQKKKTYFEKLQEKFEDEIEGEGVDERMP